MIFFSCLSNVISFTWLLQSIISDHDGQCQELKSLEAQADSQLREEKSKSSTLLQASQGAPLKTELSQQKDNQQLVLQLQQTEEKVKVCLPYLSVCLFCLFLFTFFLLIIYIVVYFDLFPHTLSWNLSICRCWQDIFLSFRLCLYKTMSCVMLRSKPTTECPTTNRLPSSCRRSCRTAVHRWKRKRTQSKLSRKNCESLRFVQRSNFPADCKTILRLVTYLYLLYSEVIYCGFVVYILLWLVLSGLFVSGSEKCPTHCRWDGKPTEKNVQNGGGADFSFW